jgi:hypothetical protein
VGKRQAVALQRIRQAIQSLYLGRGVSLTRFTTGPRTSRKLRRCLEVEAIQAGRGSCVRLYGARDSETGIGQILCIHCRADRESRVEGKKPGLGSGQIFLPQPQFFQSPFNHEANVHKRSRARLTK